MLQDERGVYGGSRALPASSMNNDTLFNYFERRDPLWESSELNTRSELGIPGPAGGYSGSSDFTFDSRRKTADVPGHRNSSLAAALNMSTSDRNWDPLHGIDRYWPESRQEAEAAGDLEERRRRARAPREGHVRIVVPHMEKGEEHLGLIMHGLQVVSIRDPKAIEMGWKVGDEVLKVNRMAVGDAQEFARAMQGAVGANRRNQAPILVDVWRQPACSVHHGPDAPALPPGGPIPNVPLSHEDRDRANAAALAMWQAYPIMEDSPRLMPPYMPSAMPNSMQMMPQMGALPYGPGTPARIVAPPYGPGMHPGTPPYGTGMPPAMGAPPYASAHDRSMMMPSGMGAPRMGGPPKTQYGFDPHVQMAALAEENAALHGQLRGLQQARQQQQFLGL